MSKCEQVDITRDKGDTYPERTRLWSKEDGAYIDITDPGYVFYMGVSATEDVDPAASSNFLFVVTGVKIDDGTAALRGKVEYPPDAADAAIVGDLFYEMWYYDPTNKKRTYRKGRYIVS